MYIYKAGVVGAGAMGAEIAQVISFSGLPVVLKDVDEARVQQGIETIRKIYQRRVDKGRASPEDMAAKMNLITGVTTYDETEIVAGVPEGAAVLVLDPGSSAGVERHAPPPETLERFSLEAEKRRQRKARAADEGRADDEPKPRAAAIEPERWDLQRRGRQKPGAIDVFPGDRPGGERDDRFPSDLR